MELLFLCVYYGCSTVFRVAHELDFGDFFKRRIAITNSLHPMLASREKKREQGAGRWLLLMLENISMEITTFGCCL